jgi:hypothetical protein
MPKVRYTPTEYSRLSKSLINWFVPSEKATEEERKVIESRVWLLDWAISEEVWSGDIAKLAKKNAAFDRALKTAKDIQESRLKTFAMSAKNPAFAIFALKNVARWSDNPQDSKAAQQTLKLVVHLPDKPKAPKHLRQPIEAQFEVIPPARLAPARIDGRTKAARKAKAAALATPGTDQKPQ